MNSAGLRAIGFAGMVLAVGAGRLSVAQTAPALAAPSAASAPADIARLPAATAASAPATRAKRPAVADVLSRKTVDFDFVAAPLNDVLQFMGKSFDVGIENVYELPDMITLKSSFNAHQAIDMINTSLEPKGYALVATVRDDDAKPRVFLTLTQIKKDAGHLVPVFRGMDPAAIPEGDEVRTQVMTVKSLDLEKYKDMITAVLGKDASININSETKTLIVTDTCTHVHTVATILQVLDTQASTGNK